MGTAGVDVLGPQGQRGETGLIGEPGPPGDIPPPFDDPTILLVKGVKGIQGVKGEAGFKGTTGDIGVSGRRVSAILCIKIIFCMSNKRLFYFERVILVLKDLQDIRGTEENQAVKENREK